MANSVLKRVALWVTGRTLALIVLVTVSVASCGTVQYTALAIFHPEQTEFPGGTLPDNFSVAIENPHANNSAERVWVLPWKWAQEHLEKEGYTAQLSIREGRHFRVMEEGPDYQVVHAWHGETAYIATRYRVQNGKIVPLSYKTDGGMEFAFYMLPLYIFGLWLGLVASRHFLKLFIARTTIRPGT